MCETRRQFERSGFTEKAIADELALIAFSDLKDYVTVDEGGAMQVLPLKTLKNKKSHVIKKIKETSTIGESKDGAVIFKNSKVEFELYDKLEALGMAVDVIGIKKPAKIDVNHSGSIMAAVASHLSGEHNGGPITRPVKQAQTGARNPDKPKERKAPVKKVVYKRMSKGKKQPKRT